MSINIQSRAVYSNEKIHGASPAMNGSSLAINGSNPLINGSFTAINGSSAPLQVPRGDERGVGPIEMSINIQSRVVYT